MSLTQARTRYYDEEVMALRITGDGGALPGRRPKSVMAFLPGQVSGHL